MNKTYYDILEISNNASQSVITAAYRTLSNQYHPDKNSGSDDSEQKMAAINVAYEVLSDPTKRKKYDDELIRERESELDKVDISRHPTVTSHGKAPFSSYLIFLFVLFSIVLFLILASAIEKNKNSTEQQMPNKLYDSTYIAENKWNEAEKLLYGDGVPKNYNKANQQYQLISIQNLFNDGRAEQRLAEIYLYGLGEKVNYADALNWYKRAGNLESTFMIGIMYLNGLGVKKDLAIAYHFFNLAQAQKYDIHPVKPNRLISALDKKIYFQNIDEENQFIRESDGGISYYANLARMKMKFIETKLTPTKILEAQNMNLVIKLNNLYNPDQVPDKADER